MVAEAGHDPFALLLHPFILDEIVHDVLDEGYRLQLDVLQSVISRPHQPLQVVVTEPWDEKNDKQRRQIVCVIVMCLKTRYILAFNASFLLHLNIYPDGVRWRQILKFKYF